MQFKNYEEVLEYLYNNLPMFQRQGATAFRKDLTRTRQLDEMLDRPHEHFKSVHIAGTNGKGSTAHMLASILQEAGYKTGLYTSPHLKDFTERIRINGQPISKKAVTDFVNSHYDRIQEIKPSFFEITVAMAFQYFKDENIDIAVLETGMGGRLDSTNIVNPLLSVITNVSYDHMQYLGNTLPEIAAEKGGIIKSHVPVVISEKQEEITEIFEKLAALNYSKLYFAEDSFSVEKENGEFAVYHNKRRWPENIKLSLLGSYQRNNLPGVLSAVNVLNDKDFNIERIHVIKGLKNVIENTGLKGRYQVLQDKPKVIVDVAHNEAGLKLVMEQLQKEEYDKLYIVYSTVNDKDLSRTWSILPSEAYYYFTQAQIPRALAAEKLAEQAYEQGMKGEVVSSVATAYKRALENAGENDLIFVGGSNFTVAEIPDL